VTAMMRITSFPGLKVLMSFEVLKAVKDDIK
jgi:hypothetical protein